MSPDNNRNARKLDLGDTLTARINDTVHVRNPLIKFSQYFIYIQPRPDDNEYMEKFRQLKEDEFVTVQIYELKEGYNGRLNCKGILVDMHAKKKHLIPKNDRIIGNENYVSPEHELQVRFGNTIPSNEQIEDIQRKWRAQERDWGVA
jgi:hypothetical protein